jgi:hypothetical protein
MHKNAAPFHSLHIVTYKSTASQRHDKHFPAETDSW